MAVFSRTQVGKGKKKWNTAPERMFDSYQRSRKLGLIQNVSLPFAVAGKEGRATFEFQLDFARPVDRETYLVTGFHDPKAGYDMDIEIDGAEHDGSLDPLKDSVKSSNGVRVIHIVGRLCRRENWGRLDFLLRRAFTSKRMVLYLRR